MARIEPRCLFTARGQSAPSSLELFQLRVRLAEPQGERLELGMAEVEVYHDVVDVGDNQEPIAATYTVLFPAKTFVMTFLGEQPSEAGLVRMLQSFQPAIK